MIPADISMTWTLSYILSKPLKDPKKYTPLTPVDAQSGGQKRRHQQRLKVHPPFQATRGPYAVLDPPPLLEELPTFFRMTNTLATGVREVWAELSRQM